MSVLLFWPRIRRALLASLSLVNVSLSCLHSIHFVSLHHSISQPSFKQSLQPFSWNFGFGGDLTMSCLHSVHFVKCFIAFKQPFSLGFRILRGFGQRPALPALYPLCLTAFSFKLSPIQCKKRSFSPAYKQPTFLEIVQFLSLAKDRTCLEFAYASKKFFLHWFRYSVY